MSSAAFHDIQYKASSGQVNLDQAQGIVECFVAGIGNKDSVGDVCATGAFTKSLMRRKPRVVWGHNWNDPIGKVLEIYEVPASDPRLPAKMRMAGIGGLYAKVQFNLSSEKGKEAFANVAFFGEEQEWSIGYKTLRAQFDPNTQANILYEVELYEVSPVLHGANQLTGTISVKSDEKGGMMPMVISPVGTPSDDERPMEQEMERKLQEELSVRLGAPVKILKMENGVVFFSRGDSGSEDSKYKCRYHMGDDGVFMFGRPERFATPRPMPVAPQMPAAPQVARPQAGMPSKPMAPAPGSSPVVIPGLVPGATPVSPPMVRFNYQDNGMPSAAGAVKPKLVDEERDLAEALIKITKRYGKFNEDSTGVWAGYRSASENPVAKIGVKCANCVLYEGEGKCKIVAQQVEPEGKCRFAVIPDGVVSMGPVQKAAYESDLDEEEVKYLEDVEEKYPGEFLSGGLRNILKRRRKRRMGMKTVFMLDEYSEKSLEDFGDFNISEFSYVLPVDANKAFEVKQLIDPIIDFHRVDAYVEDGGIVFTNGVTRDFVEAVGAAVYDPFFRSEKALGRNLAGKFQRGRGLAARFDPYAWDGDNDGIVQEGTAFERPAIPGLNDFASRGKITRSAARKIQNNWNAAKPERAEDRQEAPSAPRAPKATGRDTGLSSGKASNPTSRKLDEIIDSHDDKWDLDKTDRDFSEYLADLDPDELADAHDELKQQRRLLDIAATNEGLLEDDVRSDDFGSMVKRLMADYNMDEFDAEEEGARILDAYDEYRRRKEHYDTALKTTERARRGSGQFRTRPSSIREEYEGLMSGGKDTSGDKDLDEFFNRRVFEDRMIFGSSLDDTATNYGITRAEARQREMRHMERIRNLSGEDFDAEIYRLRQEGGASIESLGRSFGRTRKEILDAEENHLQRLADLPQNEKDEAIYSDIIGNDINGRKMPIREVAQKYNVSPQDVRDAVERQKSKERQAGKPTRSPQRLDGGTQVRRIERRERASRGAKDAQGGPETPARFTDGTFDKYDKERTSLASGAEQSWKNASDGLPIDWDNWSDDDWETYNSRRMIEIERRGPRPRGEKRANGFAEDLSGAWSKKPDGADRKVFIAYTSNEGRLLVEEANDGTYVATVEVFDDYQGFYSDEYDYDFAFDKDGFESPEEAMEWASREATSGGNFVLGSENDEFLKSQSERERLSASKKLDEVKPYSGDEDREQAWKDYYERGAGFADSRSTGSGLSSGKAPYTAGERIERQINKKRPPRTDYDYSGEDFPPTDEQMAVIDAVMTGENVVVPALAGSGKTSTLITLARRMLKEQPDKKMLYLAFNRSAADDAKRRFRGLSNVEIHTLDAIGKRFVESLPGGKDITKRLDVPGMRKGEKPSAKKVAKDMGLKTQTINGKEVAGEDIVRLAMNAVDAYEKSGDESIGLQHFIDADKNPIHPDTMPGDIIDVAKQIWDDRKSPDGEYLIGFNTLTKMWALRNPDFGKGGSGVDAKDIVLFDESQDLNPVWNTAAGRMELQRVYVGDPNQAIYGFRGAVNELDSISEKEPYVLPITEVFRFGPEIAEVGNRVLSLLGIGKNRMVGKGKAGRVVTPGTMSDPDLVIARTNGGIIREAIKFIDQGKTVGTTKRAKEELGQMINSISRIMFNSPGGEEHPELADFQNLTELKEAVDKGLATSRQRSLYGIMVSINLSDLRKVRDGMQVWDPEQDEDNVATDGDLVGLAKGNLDAFPEKRDLISSIISQFEGGKALSDKQWYWVERAAGKKRQSGQAAAAVKINIPEKISPRSSGQLTDRLSFNTTGDRFYIKGKSFNDTGNIKGEIKAAGFKWDAKEKQWYVPLDEANTALERLAAGGGERGKAQQRPDVIMLTAHLAKGLQAKKVRLAGDFWGPEKDEKTGETVWPDEEHMHAVYVALTRAQEELDPGSADWVFDWTDESDGQPNTDRSFGGLASGKSDKKKKKMNRRPWTEEERQAFADGTRLRAQTIQGKRRGSAPDDMRDAGRGGSRDARGGLSSGSDRSARMLRRERRMQSGSGLASGKGGSSALAEDLSDRDASALGAIGSQVQSVVRESSEEMFEGDEAAATGRRRGVGGRSALMTALVGKRGFGKYETDEDGNKTFKKNKDIDENSIERIAKLFKEEIKTGNLSENENRAYGDKWMVAANKFRELFKDDSGNQMEDADIADFLGIKESKLKEIDEPGAALSETFVSEVHERIFGMSDGVPDSVIKIWGYDAAPRWIDRRTGKEVSRQEFESLSRRDIAGGKVEPDLEFDAEDKQGIRSVAEAMAKVRSEREKKSTTRENYPATILARKLGVIGDTEILDSSKARKEFAAKLGELGVDASEVTIAKNWGFGGVPLSILRQLEDGGHISISEIYPDMGDRKETVSKLSATQAIVEKLEAAGLSEVQIGSIINYITGKRNGTALKNHRIAMQNGGNSRAGSEGELSMIELQERVNTANALIEKNKYNVPKISVSDITGKEAPESGSEGESDKTELPKYVPLKRTATGFDLSGISNAELVGQARTRESQILELRKAEENLTGPNRARARGIRGRLEQELRAIEAVARKRVAEKPKLVDKAKEDAETSRAERTRASIKSEAERIVKEAKKRSNNRDEIRDAIIDLIADARIETASESTTEKTRIIDDLRAEIAKITGGSAKDYVGFTSFKDIEKEKLDELGSSISNLSEEELSRMNERGLKKKKTKIKTLFSSSENVKTLDSVNVASGNSGKDTTQRTKGARAEINKRLVSWLKK